MENEIFILTFFKLYHTVTSLILIKSNNLLRLLVQTHKPNRSDNSIESCCIHRRRNDRETHS